ncbi:MAG: efflux RND transporter permease subunit, partial [Burkholderiales bacterium]
MRRPTPLRAWFGICLALSLLCAGCNVTEDDTIGHVFSRFFIDRPIFSTVVSIVIVLIGGVSLATLPVAQFPEVSPPTVTISATYPGASAEVMSDVVAGPIEEQVNGTEGMLYMSATSGTGSASITVTLDIGTDPADATVDINNRVRVAEPRLPEEVRRLGVVVRERSTNIVLIASLLSPDGRHNAVELTNYSQLNVIDELKRIPGVGDASLFGTQNYAMRIWVQPDLMRQYALTTSDIAAAIGEQNSQFAAGQIGAPPNDGKVPFTYTVTTKGRLLETSEFENIVLRANPDGSLLRLKDVARVELGAQGYDFIGKVNGQTAVNMGVYLQSGANALDVAAAVRARRWRGGVTSDLDYRQAEVALQNAAAVITNLE